ncbi:hypothetical protein EAG_02283 [Camponotus floridanus]|uniref:Uncharacterized protein n=1 Tax=Camponotus floridanus TaxID=104421 RepID=E2AMX4_CAMFO|nr:hypothetical protein EAG_02283 [Camponotus floridanus]
MLAYTGQRTMQQRKYDKELQLRLQGNSRREMRLGHQKLGYSAHVSSLSGEKIKEMFQTKVVWLEGGPSDSGNDLTLESHLKVTETIGKLEFVAREKSISKDNKKALSNITRELNFSH